MNKIFSAISRMTQHPNLAEALDQLPGRLFMPTGDDWQTRYVQACRKVAVGETEALAELGDLVAQALKTVNPVDASDDLARVVMERMTWFYGLRLTEEQYLAAGEEVEDLINLWYINRDLPLSPPMVIETEEGGQAVICSINQLDRWYFPMKMFNAVLTGLDLYADSLDPDLVAETDHTILEILETLLPRTA